MQGRELDTSFLTGLHLDFDRPFVVTSSSTGAGVPTTTTVTLTLSEDIDSLTIGSRAALLSGPEGYRETHATLAGRTLTIVPDAPLTPGATYQVVLSPDITDLAGNSLRNTASAFATAP